MNVDSCQICLQSLNCFHYNKGKSMQSMVSYLFIVYQFFYWNRPIGLAVIRQVLFPQNAFILTRQRPNNLVAIPPTDHWMALFPSSWK